MSAMQSLNLPAGTLQFEIFQNKITLKGGPKLDFVWIKPPVPAVGEDRYVGCDCTIRYEVLEHLLPKYYQETMRLKRVRINSTAPSYVCACVGRVIE